MLKEKLVCYDLPPSEVYRQLESGWLEQGFIIRVLDQDKGTLICTGRIVNRVRVDLFILCMPEGEGTAVQMIYSPLLTPALSRPTKLNNDAQEEVLDDLETRMMGVLNDIGDWQVVEPGEIQDHSERLEDPLNLRVLSSKKSILRQIGLGLALIAFGALMLYLFVSETWAIGSYTLWMIVSVVGITLFCTGLFRLTWQR